MKITACVFPISLGRPLENAEKIKEITEKISGDIYLFPAYALSGVSCGKLPNLPSFKKEEEKAVDVLCEYTEKNDKCIVTSTFSDGNIAIYGGDINKSGKFVFDSKTISVSQSGKDSADIVLIPTAMPSYPCIKNDVSEFCSELSKQKNGVVAVANAGYGESTADDVFRGFCGVFNRGTIVAFSSQDKAETVVSSAEDDKTDGIVYARPKRIADKIPYYTKNDVSIYISELVELQKQAVYARAKFLGVKKLFVDIGDNSESLLALYVLSKTAEDLGLFPSDVVVFSVSEKTENTVSSFGFTAAPAVSDNMRIRKAEILDLAEKENALFVGILPLSEIAYGNISLLRENVCHYNMNASLPRTVLWDAVKNVFRDDEETLRLAEEFCSVEKNLEIRYDLFDFWLYYFAKHNVGREELKNYALATFDEYDDDMIEASLIRFISSYKKNQEIRSATVEGANFIGFVLPYIPTDADYVI